MQNKLWALSAVLLIVVALAASGCTSPTPTPQPSIDTPEKVVKAYWQDIDRGDYEAAYDLSYPVQNLTRQQWIDQHRAAWGDNGTNIRIYNFTVLSTHTLDPSTFPGNFTGIESVVAYTEVSYYGKNTTGTSQFAAVKADDSWKFYGNY
jgi:hypothetical protein